MPNRLDPRGSAGRSRVGRRLTMTRLSMIVVLGACSRGDDRGPATRRPAATASVAISSEAAARLAPPPSPALDARIAAEEQVAIGRLPAGSGRDLVVGNCLICHAATLIEQQHKDTTAWNKTVTQMITFGAPVPGDRRAELVAYLATHFGITGG
jgi:cytochrome c5